MLPSTRESAPSTLRLVAAILAALVVVVLLVVAGVWLWNESFVYRGNGTRFPNP